MNSKANKSLFSLMVLGLVLFAASSRSAKAQSIFTIDLYQDGSNVVATGSGTIDLDGTSYVEDLTTTTDELIPDGATITVGVTPSDATFYSGLTAPDNFGSGGNTSATSSTGDVVAVTGTILLVPRGYVSGTALSDTATWDDATLDSLGVTPGTYTWTWGTDNENTFTLNAVAVPEPYEYGWGILCATLGVVAWRRFSPCFAARISSI